MFQTLTNPITDIAGLEAIAGSVGDLVTNLTLAVYGGVIVPTVLFQGLNARYYFARIKRVEDYLRETPAGSSTFSAPRRRCSVTLAYNTRTAHLSASQ